MLIDTHAHLNFNAFKEDADEVIKRSLDNGVWMINVGSQYTTSKRAVEIAEKYLEGVFAAIGLHPIHLETGLVKIKNDIEEIEIKTTEQDFDYARYKELAQNPRVVAVGEIGLDYYWKPKTKNKLAQFKEKQRNALCRQLELAKELNLPAIFHCRMAHDDLIKILTDLRNSNKSTGAQKLLMGVVHCFTGNLEQAKKYLAMGLYLGFNGIIFKKIEGISFEGVIKYAPLDRVLIETDCPYLTPPLPAVAFLASVAEATSAKEAAKAGPPPIRNEPLYVKYIAQRIAKIKNMGYEEIAKITAENGKKLFNI